MAFLFKENTLNVTYMNYMLYSSYFCPFCSPRKMRLNKQAIGERE